MNHHKNAIAVYDSIAELYQSKFMDMTIYDDTYDVFCSRIAVKDPEVLELACGPGNISRYILAKRPDINLLGTDAAPKMVALAAANNPTAKFSVLDYRDVLALNLTFDGIISGFLVPYLSREDCLKFIADCAALLNPGGITYFSLVEGDYQNSEYQTGSNGNRVFLYYHDAAFLNEALLENGFSEIEQIRKIYPERNNQTHLIFIAKKL